MLESVNARLEAGAIQKIQKLAIDSIFSLGDKVERGAKSIFPCNFQQLRDAIEALLSLHIMGQNESKLFALGPAGPADGDSTGGRVNRPHCGKRLPSAISTPLAKRYAKTPRQEWA